MIDFSYAVDQLVGFYPDDVKETRAVKEIQPEPDNWGIEVRNSGKGHDGIVLDIYSYGHNYEKTPLISLHMGTAKHPPDGDPCPHLHVRQLIQALEMAMEAEKYDDEF